ncbi:MAG: autotransporter-associated beta strand repeat-containing protein [Verrucomicrobiae bacterium]
MTVNGNGYFNVGSTATSTNLINPLATLTIGGNGGGYYNFVCSSTAANKQTFASLTVGSGDDVLYTSGNATTTSQFTFTGANPYLRSVGGVARFLGFDSNTKFTNAPSGTGNVIGSGATAMLVGAVSATATMLDASNFVLAPSAGGGLTALTSAANSWGTGINTAVAAGSTAPGALSQSLSFAAGGSLTLPGAFTVESGGILVTSTPTIPVTITGGTIKTGISGGDLWIVQSGSGMAGGQLVDPTHGLIINSQIIDNGGSSLTKVGARGLYLTNTNNTYTGGTFLAEGTLNVASAGSLGIGGALNFTGNAAFQAAGNVDLGTRAVNIGTGLVATIDTNSNNITVGGVISGVNSALTKTGLGTLTLTGNNTYTGITTVNNGSLKLDFSASGAPQNNIINSNSILNLGSLACVDSLIIQGAAGVANIQTFGATPSPLNNTGATNFLGGMNNLVFNAGTGGSLTVNLGNITLAGAAYMDVTTSGNVTVAGVNATSASLYLDKAFVNSGGNSNAWATVNKSTWATANSSGNLVGWANSAYQTNFTGAIGSSNQMYDITTSGTLSSQYTGAAATLRFNDTLNTGVGKTVTLVGTQVTQLLMGGILVTSNVGAQDSTITGGFLTGANLTRLGIFQNNTAGNLIINSTIVDQANGCNVTKNGAGTVILNGVNSNTVGIIVNEGTLIATGDYMPSSVKTITTTAGSNVVTMSDTTGLFVGQELMGNTPGLTVVNGGLPNVVTAINPGVSVTLTTYAQASNTLSATFTSGGAIGGAAPTAVNLVLPTTYIANGATLQIGSAATGNHGGIDPNVTINNQGALILSHSGPYTFGNTIIGAPVNNSAVGNLAINSLVGTNATNTLEITGGGTTTLGFYGIVNGSGAGGQKIYTLATPGNVYAGMSVTGTGIPGGTVVSYVDGVNVGLTNAISTGGATNATFQTANTFNGATRITGGSTLTLGSNLALQYSTLLYNNSDSGTFSFGTQTAVTLGGLAGDKNLALTNAASAAVALTVGGVYNSNTVTNNFNTTYSGILSGNGSLTKNGIGITTLSGANTYSGGTTVTAGTLQLGNASALGASAGAVSVASGATLDVNATMTNTNALTLNGQGYSIAALTNTSASPATYAGTVAMASDTNIGGSNGTLTLGGIVSGTFNLTKVGTDTLIFGNVANTFGTGKTFTIVAGTVQLGNAASLGAATNAVSLRDGAALDLYGQTVANTNALTLNGTGISSGGALTNTSATGASYAGLITLGSASSIIAGSGNITISNVATIAGPTFGLTLGGAYNGSLASIIGTTTGSLTKQDAGTWTLSGANTYTGATTISAGTLKLGVAGALGNATTHTSGVTVSATGALDLNGFTPTATTVALTLNGSGVSNGGALTNSGSAATYGGTVALATASTIGATSSSSSITLTGVISGAGGLTKVGADTLYLNGNNTFTGNVTINGGEVRLGNAGALNNTPGSENAVAFGSGSTGTLSLNGNNVTIANLTTDPTTPGTTIVQNMSGTNTLTVGNSLNLSGTYAGTIQEIGVLALTKAGTGTLTLTGTNTYTGTTTISAGTLQLGTGGQLTSSAIVNNANFAINSTGVVQQGNELSSAAITGTGTFTQAGTGTTTLNAANAFLGKTIVQNGTLSFTTGSATATAAQSLGANAALDLGVASTSSGILKYTGTGGATLAKNINALGNGSDTIQNSGTGLLTLTGTLTKNGTVLTLKGGTGGITVSGTGTIAGSNAGSDLVVDGGNVTLSTANTYNGPTSIINGATLTANATGALPTAIRSAVSIDQTGSGTSTLALGASQSAASLTGNLTSKVTLGSNTLTLGMTGNSTTTFAGVISGTNGNVIKDGTSIQVFSGNNTYTGTTAVNEGTLEAAAAGALGATSAITVTNTGTLLLSANAATSNSTTLTLNGGKVELKTGPSVSTSLGALTLTDTSIIDFGLSSTNNILTLGAVTSWTSTKTIEIWNWSGTPFFGGGSERLMVSDTTGWTTNLGSINFFTDSGTTLIGGGGAMFAGYELVAVPEPATWSYMAAIALGGAALLIRRRRLIGRLKY